MDFLTAGTKARDLYTQYCRSICKKYGINQTGLDVVMFLSACPEHNTARDICNHRGLKSGLTSVILEQLIGKGLLERSDDPWDGRVKRLQLTEKAAPIVADGKIVEKEFFSRLGAGLTQEEFETFWALSERIIENIVEMEKTSGK